MGKIVTGFKSFEDVEKYLAVVEKYTDWTWSGTSKPTEVNFWRLVFNTKQERGGFCLDFSNYFGLGSLEGIGRNCEQINFEDAIRILMEQKTGKYLVSVDGSLAPTRIHNTLEEAKKEAERLVKKERRTVRVLEEVGRYEVSFNYITD